MLDHLLFFRWSKVLSGLGISLLNYFLNCFGLNITIVRISLHLVWLVSSFNWRGCARSLLNELVYYLHSLHPILKIGTKEPLIFHRTNTVWVILSWSRIVSPKAWLRLLNLAFLQVWCILQSWSMTLSSDYALTSLLLIRTLGLGKAIVQRLTAFRSYRRCIDR